MALVRLVPISLAEFFHGVRNSPASSLFSGESGRLPRKVRQHWLHIARFKFAEQSAQQT